MTISSTGTASLRMELYDSGGNILYSSPEEGQIALTRTLLPGNYEVRVLRSQDANPAPQSYEITFTGRQTGVILPNVAVGTKASALTEVSIFFPSPQSISAGSKKAKTIKCFAAVSNRGTISGQINVLAGPESSSFKLIYIGARGNSTASLVTGAYQTGNLPPNASESFSIKAKPNKKKLKKRTSTGVRFKSAKHTVSILAKAIDAASNQDAAEILLKTK